MAHTDTLSKIGLSGSVCLMMLVNDTRSYAKSKSGADLLSWRSQVGLAACPCIVAGQVERTSVRQSVHQLDDLQVAEATTLIA